MPRKGRLPTYLNEPADALRWLGYIDLEHGPMPETERDFDRNNCHVPVGVCERCGDIIMYYAKNREAHRRRCK